MKNNKGFISVTVIYAFFLVFLTLMLYIVTNMAVNRNFLNNMKKTIVIALLSLSLFGKTYEIVEPHFIDEIKSKGDVFQEKYKKITEKSP